MRELEYKYPHFDLKPGGPQPPDDPFRPLWPSGGGGPHLPLKPIGGGIK